jgi:hypothetical protein
MSRYVRSHPKSGSKADIAALRIICQHPTFAGLSGFYVAHPGAAFSLPPDFKEYGTLKLVECWGAMCRQVLLTEFDLCGWIRCEPAPPPRLERTTSQFPRPTRTAAIFYDRKHLPIAEGATHEPHAKTQDLYWMLAASPHLWLDSTRSP